MGVEQRMEVIVRRSGISDIDWEWSAEVAGDRI